MKSSWCLWSIPLKEGFRNEPHSLRCDFSVTYFCFPLFKCPILVIRLIDIATQLTAVLQLDPWILAKIFVASAYVLTADLNQEDCCCCLKV
jgi:hypothetical protein